MSIKIFDQLYSQLFSILKKNDITFVPNQRPTKKDFFYFLAGYNESDEIADFFDKKEDEYEIGSSDAPSIFADLI